MMPTPPSSRYVPSLTDTVSRADDRLLGHDRGPDVPSLERVEVPGGERADVPFHERREYAFDTHP